MAPAGRSRYRGRAHHAQGAPDASCGPDASPVAAKVLFGEARLGKYELSPIMMERSAAQAVRKTASAAFASLRWSSSHIRGLPAGVLQPYRRRFRWEVHHRDRGPEVLKERVLVLLLICYVKSVLGRLVLQARDPVDEGQSRVLLSSGRLDLPTSPATGRSIRRP